MARSLLVLLFVCGCDPMVRPAPDVPADDHDTPATDAGLDAGVTDDAMPPPIDAMPPPMDATPPIDAMPPMDAMPPPMDAMREGPPPDARPDGPPPRDGAPPDGLPPRDAPRP